MIKVNAISIGKIETLSYGNYKPMQSALNKIPFKRSNVAQSTWVRGR